MTSPRPAQCIRCKHKDIMEWKCDAFPDGIPEDIIDGEFDHNKPYPGDNGIMFEEEE